MAILTYPLNGILYDAEDVETYLCTRTSGVFASDGHFPASVTGSRQVTIGPGLAWMQNEEFHGKAIYNPENVALEIAEADAYQTRIDRIILRFDKLLNKTDLMVLQGEPGQGAPDIERDSLVYDLGLYTVNVKNSTASLSASDVVSSMLDDSVCGIMEDAVTSIPTQELYDAWYSWFSNLQADTETMENQFNVWFEQIREEAEQYMTETENSFDVWMNGQKVDFDVWFDSIQDTLDGDTAGKLTNLVNDAQDTADEALEQLITGVVTGFMTEEYTGGEYGLLSDDSDDSHAITLSKNICDCEGNTSADMSMISDEFNESYTYKEGDYCIYENTLFVFTADKSAGAWDWDCVRETNVSTEIANHTSEIASHTSEIADMSAQVDSLNNTVSSLRNYEISAISYTGSQVAVSADSNSSQITVASVSRSGYNTIGLMSYYVENGTGYNAGWCHVYACWLSNNTVYAVLHNCGNNAANCRVVAVVLYQRSTNITTSSITDDGGDAKTAPGPEIIDPDDDGNDDDTNVGTLEPGEVIPDDDGDENPAPDNPEEVE